MCLIWGESSAVLKEYNIARHHDLKHKKKLSMLYKKKKLSYKKGTWVTKHVFKKESIDSSSALWASYYVSHMQVQEGKPFSNVDFVWKCLYHEVETCVWKNKPSLMIWPVEHSDSDLPNQHRNNKYENFCSAEYK